MDGPNPGQYNPDYKKTFDNKGGFIPKNSNYSKYPKIDQIGPGEYQTNYSSINNKGIKFG